MRATPDRRRRATRLFVAVAALLATAASPPDWPQFRGPERDGISPETGFLTAWPEGGPAVLWRRPLGKGYSAVSVVGGHLYTQWSAGGDEHVGAFDVTDGRELWRVRTDAERPDGFGDGPRSTPTLAGGRVYAVSAYGKLHALDAATGEVVWRRDLVKEDGGRVPNWGVAASPLLVDGKLLFNVGARDAAVAAFDVASGAPLWRAAADIPGYSAPILVEVGGVRQAIVLSGSRILSLDPDDGTVHWSVPWSTSYDVNASTPVFVAPNKLFVSTGYDTGAALYTLGVAEGKPTVAETWRNRRMKNQFSSSVYHAGSLYGFDNKTLKCIDMATGEDRWRKSGFGHGSLFLADGHLVVLSDDGVLALVAATPDGYVERATARVAQGRHWTVPTLSDGRLFVRNERELMALDLRGPGTTPEKES